MDVYQQVQTAWAGLFPSVLAGAIVAAGCVFLAGHDRVLNRLTTFWRYWRSLVPPEMDPFSAKSAFSAVARIAAVLLIAQLFISLSAIVASAIPLTLAPHPTRVILSQVGDLYAVDLCTAAQTRSDALVYAQQARRILHAWQPATASNAPDFHAVDQQAFASGFLWCKAALLYFLIVYLGMRMLLRRPDKALPVRFALLIGMTLIAALVAYAGYDTAGTESAQLRATPAFDQQQLVVLRRTEAADIAGRLVTPSYCQDLARRRIETELATEPHNCVLSLWRDYRSCVNYAPPLPVLDPASFLGFQKPTPPSANDVPQH